MTAAAKEIIDLHRPKKNYLRSRKYSKSVWIPRRPQNHQASNRDTEINKNMRRTKTLEESNSRFDSTILQKEQSDKNNNTKNQYCERPYQTEATENQYRPKWKMSHRAK
jgi:hypothetical protein